MKMKLLALVVMALGIVSVVQAQTTDCPAMPSGTVIDPTTVCFKSMDWNTVVNQGINVVTSAEVVVYAQSTGTGGPVVSRHVVGKPAPAGTDSTGAFVIKAPWVRDPNEKQDGATAYIAVVELIGQGGQVSRSPLGNPFVYNQVVPAPKPATAPIISRP
jgi:hypothetical protein